jgi:hypothetical protein
MVLAALLTWMNGIEGLEGEPAARKVVWVFPRFDQLDIVA